LDHHHLTYRPRSAITATVLATVAAAIGLLLAAPAQAEEPIGGTALAQQALDQARGTLGDGAGAAGETLAGAQVPNGDAAVSGAVDQGPAVQQGPVGTPAAGGGSQQEPAPAAGGAVVERPGAVSGVEKTVEPVLRSGDGAVKDAAAAVKQAQADAGALLDIPIVGAAVQPRDTDPSATPRAASANVAPPRRTAGAAGPNATASVSSSPVTVRTSAVLRRSGPSDLRPYSTPVTAAARVDTARPAQQTGLGGGATASTGLGVGAAAMLLAAWLLAVGGLRTRILSSPAMSPALGFTSLLERPG
jgi:hypothetical protein